MPTTTPSFQEGAFSLHVDAEPLSERLALAGRSDMALHPMLQLPGCRLAYAPDGTQFITVPITELNVAHHSPTENDAVKGMGLNAISGLPGETHEFSHLANRFASFSPLAFGASFTFQEPLM